MHCFSWSWKEQLVLGLKHSDSAIWQDLCVSHLTLLGLRSLVAASNLVWELFGHLWSKWPEPGQILYNNPETTYLTQDLIARPCAHTQKPLLASGTCGHSFPCNSAHFRRIHANTHQITESQSHTNRHYEMSRHITEAVPDKNVWFHVVYFETIDCKYLMYGHFVMKLEFGCSMRKKQPRTKATRSNSTMRQAILDKHPTLDQGPFNKALEKTL